MMNTLDGYRPVMVSADTGSETTTNKEGVSPKSVPREYVGGVLVLPALAAKIDGLMLKATTVVTLADLISAIQTDSNAICEFTNLRVLKCAVEYRDLIAPDLYVLRGYPGAVYDEAFNAVVWPLEDVSYDILQSELAAAARAESLLRNERAENAPRAEGVKVIKTIRPDKPFTRFDVARGPGDRTTEDRPDGGDDGDS